MRVDVKLMIILIAIVLLATVGSAFVTSWVFNGRMAGFADNPSGEVLIGQFDYNPDLIWDAGEYTVNLAPTGRIIRTGMSLKVDKKATAERLEQRVLLVRDRVITALVTTSTQELSHEAGINKFKERIMNVVNEMIADEGGMVQDVYFSELVVQY